MKPQEGITVLLTVGKRTIPKPQREKHARIWLHRARTHGSPTSIRRGGISSSEVRPSEVPSAVPDANRFSCFHGAPKTPVILSLHFVPPSLILLYVSYPTKFDFLHTGYRADVSGTRVFCHRNEGIRLWPRDLFSLVCRTLPPAAVWT